MSTRHFHAYQGDFKQDRTTKIILEIIVFCGMVSCATAAPVDVCLLNEAALSRDVLRHVEAGLKMREKELGVLIRFTCAADVEDAIIISLRHVPAPKQHPDALGAALMENGKVLRQVEVFTDPVRRLVAARWSPFPALEGWAFGTVAAHEMWHYLHNEHDHGKGWMNEKIMGPEDLVRGFRTLH